MNGWNPPAGGQSDKQAPEPAGRVHPDDATGPHDPAHADPTSVTADSAQGVHGEDGDSIDVGHGHGHDREHGHDHELTRGHPTGVKGFCYRFFMPHSHDAAHSTDDALDANTAGIRAVKISLILLAITAMLQFVVVVISGSVALLADTIHNLSDALTAVPLWVAFVLAGGRPAGATRTATDGWRTWRDCYRGHDRDLGRGGRIESIRRFIEPQPVTNLGWVLAAALIGFAGNELVAVYRIRVGRRIGSAALVADGVHARTDGFTSLAVVLGVIGVWLGFPLADPIVGLLISAAIVMLLIGTSRDIGRRLLDGIDPGLVEHAERTVPSVPGITTVDDLRMRWAGHRLSSKPPSAVTRRCRSGSSTSSSTTPPISYGALCRASPRCGSTRPPTCRRTRHYTCNPGDQFSRSRRPLLAGGADRCHEVRGLGTLAIPGSSLTTGSEDSRVSSKPAPRLLL